MNFDYEDTDVRAKGRGRGGKRAAPKRTTERVVNPKFVEMAKATLKPIHPWTVNQREYMRLLNEKNIIFATGYAGTSKTYLPTAIACNEYLVKNINKIVLTRPNISNSKSLGMFKGTLVEKMTPWLGPVLSVMKEYLGDEVLNLALEKGNIEFVPMEVIKGYSFNDCFVICDEAEDLDFDDAKKLVTRQGKNCKMVLAGDITQSELKKGSGMEKLIELSSKHPALNAGHIDFNSYEDIVRSKEVREWIKIFHKEGL